MDLSTYVRKPFTVEAVKITEENIEEIAQLVGTLKQKEDGTPYIEVDRKKVPSMLQVFVGSYMTKMGNNIRCYSPKVFEEQFTELTPEIKTWVDYVNSKHDSETVINGG